MVRAVCVHVHTCWFWGNTWQCSGFIPSFALRNHTWWAQRTIWEAGDQLCARQATCQMYYCSRSLNVTILDCDIKSFCKMLFWRKPNKELFTIISKSIFSDQKNSCTGWTLLMVRVYYENYFRLGHTPGSVWDQTRVRRQVPYPLVYLCLLVTQVKCLKYEV